MGTGMIESMIEPHMKGKAHATQEEVGLAFMTFALLYTFASPLAGYVSYLNIVDRLHMCNFMYKSS